MIEIQRRPLLVAGLFTTRPEHGRPQLMDIRVELVDCRIVLAAGTGRTFVEIDAGGHYGEPFPPFYLPGPRVYATPYTDQRTWSVWVDPEIGFKDAPNQDSNDVGCHGPPADWRQRIRDWWHAPRPEPWSVDATDMLPLIHAGNMLGYQAVRLHCGGGAVAAWPFAEGCAFVRTCPMDQGFDGPLPSWLGGRHED